MTTATAYEQGLVTKSEAFEIIGSKLEQTIEQQNKVLWELREDLEKLAHLYENWGTK